MWHDGNTVAMEKQQWDRCVLLKYTGLGQQYETLKAVPWQGTVKCEETENQQNATNRCLLSTSVSTCFRHHYAHLQENKDRDTACGVLLWFCWMWLVAVVGRCPTTATNHIQQNQRSTPYAVTRSLFSWRWAYWCPKHVETEVDNKHLIVTSCWFFLSLHTLLTMHGHRSLKLENESVTANCILILLWTRQWFIKPNMQVTCDQ